MSSRLPLVSVLFLVAVCGCDSKNTGPRSGLGERDPEADQRSKTQLLAENLRQRYGANIQKRQDGSWSVHYPNTATPLMSDDDLRPLDALTPLAELNLAEAKITEAAAVRLRRYTSLEWLSLVATEFGDNGLRELLPLQKLTSLGVGRRTTDAGMLTVTSFPKLHTLALTSSAVSNKGLRELKNLPELKALSLSGTTISDAGLEAVSEIKSLRNLDMIIAPITDAGVKHLVNLPALEVLDLTRTRVTDASLKHLEGLKSLRVLRVKDTDVTKDGVAAFRKARKEVNLTSD